MFNQNFKNLSNHQIQSNFLTMMMMLSETLKRQISLIRDTKRKTQSSTIRSSIRAKIHIFEMFIFTLKELRI